MTKKQPKKIETACHADQKNFFESIAPLIAPLAQRLQLQEDLLLALVAFEDSWGQDEHNKRLHNLFGITQAGGNNLAFETYQACIDYWELHFGPQVKGIQDLDAFIAAMKKIGYNSVNAAYYETFKKVYASVQKYKLACTTK